MEPGQKLALLERVERRYPDDENMRRLLHELRRAAEAEAAGGETRPRLRRGARSSA